MSEETEFTGNDVAEAVKKACEAFHVAQEHLDITVVSTGSLGIFGLCKKMARIRASVKKEREQGGDVTVERAGGSRPGEEDEPPPSSAGAVEPEPEAWEEDEGDLEYPAAPPPELDHATCLAIRDMLAQLLARLGCGTVPEMTQGRHGLELRIAGEDGSYLIGRDGEVLDALQYIFRKMVSKKFPGKTAVSLDIGNFRESRAKELTALAVKLAAEVKESGQSRTMPALNPADRRTVHMALQGEDRIRSKSVGDGLLKKVLIFLPGKGKKPAPKRKRGGRPKANPNNDHLRAE